MEIFNLRRDGMVGMLLMLRIMVWEALFLYLYGCGLVTEE